MAEIPSPRSKGAHQAGRTGRGATVTDVWRVGNVTITRIEERIYRFPILDFIPEATPGMLAPHLDWLVDYGVDDPGMLAMPVNGYLIESQGRRVLVDTCVGIEHSDSEPTSPFLERLQLLGIDPATIGIVVCTHFHYDHVGWNTSLVDGERLPTFANARYLFAQAEWDAVRAWTPTSDLEASLRESFDREVGTIVAGGQAELVHAPLRVTPEIAMVPTPGHSPGHVSVAIASEGAAAFITGDAIHHPVQLTEPAVGTTADDDPRATVVTREAVIDQLIDRDVLLIGSHFGGAGAGFVRREDHRVVLRTPEGERP